MCLFVFGLLGEGGAGGEGKGWGEVKGIKWFKGSGGRNIGKKEC